MDLIKGCVRLCQSEPNAPLDISGKWQACSRQSRILNDPIVTSTVLQKDHEQVPRILDDLRESLEIVESIR